MGHPGLSLSQRHSSPKLTSCLTQGPTSPSGWMLLGSKPPPSSPSLPAPLPILWRRDLLSGQLQLQSPSWESQAAEGCAASLCCPILIPWLLRWYYSGEHTPNLPHAHLCLRDGFLEKRAHGHGIHSLQERGCPQRG